MRRQHREDLALCGELVEAERCRIVADLHDGVVQDLAGVSFGLSAFANRAEDPGVERQLTAADRTRKAVGSLAHSARRHLPPNLRRRAGLGAALQDLAIGLDAHVELRHGRWSASGRHLSQAFYGSPGRVPRTSRSTQGATAVSISLTGWGSGCSPSPTTAGVPSTPAQSGHRTDPDAGISRP